MERCKNEISRIEFDSLKDDVKELKKVYDKINSIAVSTEKLATEMKFMREEQNKLDSRVKNIEEKPVKRYDSVITNIINLVVGAIVGAIIALITKK